MDASSEVLAINQALPDDDARRGRYVQPDVFAWQPGAQYDIVLFSFWLSHVRPDRFAEFWGLVRASLAPVGRVFSID